jgi:hypothetical protein
MKYLKLIILLSISVLIIYRIERKLILFLKTLKSNNKTLNLMSIKYQIKLKIR